MSSRVLSSWVNHSQRKKYVDGFPFSKELLPGDICECHDEEAPVFMRVEEIVKDETTGLTCPFLYFLTNLEVCELVSDGVIK